MMERKRAEKKLFVPPIIVTFGYTLVANNFQVNFLGARQQFEGAIALPCPFLTTVRHWEIVHCSLIPTFRDFFVAVYRKQKTPFLLVSPKLTNVKKCRIVFESIFVARAQSYINPFSSWPKGK